MLQLANRAGGVLGAPFTVGDTSVVLASGTGATSRLPASGDYAIRITDSYSEPTYEILLWCTGRTGDTLTVEATAEDGSSGTAAAAGAFVDWDFTARAVAQFQADTLAGLLGSGAIFPGTYLPTPNVGWAGYSATLRISSGVILLTATTWKIGMLIVSGSGHCASLVLKRTLPYSTDVVDTTPITVGGLSSFTLTPGETFTDAIAVPVDLLHDYYLAAYFDTDGSPALGVCQGNNYVLVGGGVSSGDRTGDTSVSTWPETLAVSLFSRALKVS
jgi:hypothetical protein